MSTTETTTPEARRSRATVDVDALAEVRHHCLHDADIHADRPGFSSWQIGPQWADVTVYLEGTPQEMRDLADRIVLAVNLYEAKRLTRGEAVSA